MTYKHLDAHEREVIAQELAKGSSLRAIARKLERAPGTICREARRHRAEDGAYWAHEAHHRALGKRQIARRQRKLADQRAEGLWFKIRNKLGRRWSPAQIACWLRRTYPDTRELWVSHTTIYHAIHLLPKGELKREVLRCLRQQGKARASGAAKPPGKPWVQQLIHDRPAEVLARDALGHFEGDLLLGKASCLAAVGVLLERTTRRISLIKLERRDAYSAYQGFAAKLSRMPKGVCQTLTYDQGSEMAEHRRLTKKTGIAVYFCDPHSPWQRAGCENINGLLRQYLPKGSDFSSLSQPTLDAIALSLNTRPRAVLNFRSPNEVWHHMLNGLSFEQATNQPIIPDTLHL